MRKKVSIVMLVCLFLMHTIGSIVPSNAAILPVNLTDVKLYYEDSNNVEHDIELNSGYRLSLGERVKLEYKWELPNDTGYLEGDTYEFTLPDVFELFSDIGPFDLPTAGGSVGTFSVSQADKKVIMTFNGLVENLSNIGGTLFFWSLIDEHLTGPTTVNIDFPLVGAGKVIPVNLQPAGGTPIVKSGEPDHSYNGKELYWTINVNTGLNTIENAVVTDPIGAGHELDETTVEVRQLDVALDGTVTEVGLVDPSEYSASFVDDILTIDLGDINTAYRIYFMTDVTDENDGPITFPNTATLSGDNIDDLPSTASITIDRGEPLNKRSSDYNSTTQTIEWEIQYNYNQKSIDQADAVLTDEFESEDNLAMALDTGSFVVTRVTLDANGEEASSDPVLPAEYTVTPNGQGFTFAFNDAITDAYKIVYTTRIVENVYNNHNVTNTVEIAGMDPLPAIRGVTQQILHKSHDLGSANYSAKEINWSISLNGNGYPMENAVITDSFTNRGLTLLPGTVVVQNAVTNAILDADVDYELVDVDEDGFVIRFLSTINHRHTITYTTVFTHDDKTNPATGFENHAVILWEEGGDPQLTKSAESTFDPGEFTNNNGFKSGSYNAVSKELTWTVGVNYNLNTINNAVVEDYLLQGQELVADSIVVRPMTLNSGIHDYTLGTALEPGTDYTVTEVTDGMDNPGFRIGFANTINSAYHITFKTSIAGQLIDGSYSNTATLSGDGYGPISLNASVGINHGTEYTDKSGSQNGLKIEWTVNINRGQSALPAGAKIIDTPSNNQILLEDSFRLFGTNVAANGDVVKNAEDELTQGIDYTLEVITNELTDAQTFELTFLNAIDSAYVLEYESFINASNGQFVTNEVEFVGEGVTVDTTSNRAVEVNLSGGGGSGSGTVGSLTVTKVDADNHSQVLEGADFTLYFASNNKKIRTLTTGADGKAVFNNLLLTNYILVEDSAPDGYAIGITDTYPVTINAEALEPELTIENRNLTAPSGRLGDYLWHDINGNGIQEDGEPGIEGVTVHLYDATDPENLVLLDTMQTDATGHYLFTQLYEGDYVVHFERPGGVYADHLFTHRYSETDEAVDSNVDAEGWSEVITLGVAEYNLTIDAGVVEPASLGDYVWVDSNGNGIQNAGEPGLNEVVVELYNENEEKIAETTTVNHPTTNQPGYYIFDNLLPAAYKVKVIPKPGYMITTKGAGADRSLDSDIGIDGFTEAVTLAPGEHNPDLDAGLRVIPSSGGPYYAALGDYVWLDLNGDGLQDANEPGVNGVTVELYNENDALIGTRTTADLNGKSGYYLFDNLLPGYSYYVKFILPSGYKFTTSLAGQDRGLDSNANQDGLTAAVHLSAGARDLSIDAGLIKVEPIVPDPEVPNVPVELPEDPTEDPDNSSVPGNTQGGNDELEEPADPEGNASGSQGQQTQNEDARASDEQAAGTGKLPQTGENAPIMPWIGLALIATAGYLTFRRFRLKAGKIN